MLGKESEREREREREGGGKRWGYHVANVVGGGSGNKDGGIIIGV